MKVEVKNLFKTTVSDLSDLPSGYFNGKIDSLEGPFFKVNISGYQWVVVQVADPHMIWSFEYQPHTVVYNWQPLDPKTITIEC